MSDSQNSPTDDGDGEVVQSSAREIVDIAKHRAHEHESKVQHVTDPEEMAFFKGLAAAYRSIIEENVDLDEWEEYVSRRTCPSCDGQGCDLCEGYGYVIVDEEVSPND